MLEVNSKINLLSVAPKASTSIKKTMTEQRIEAGD